ncbi:unnamed protein product [Macrosiphum euphorbiae]|uniref:Uncharacterized protein n=1 Tax=Macrosiphum euphorbiae TaxID=13131 RepID=A0AAV0WD99_9HEMI|nr:unnamed protein product [Macrosiphum euphorbiae]
MYPIGTISDQRYKDIFIAFATLPGHTAIRDPIEWVMVYTKVVSSIS